VRRAAGARREAVVTAGLPWVAPAYRRLRSGWAVVTPGGRALMALAVTAWLAAWRLGWAEMAVIAGGSLFLLVVAAAFLLGRTNLRVTLEAEPPRVTVGDAVAGSIDIVNRSKWPLLPLVLEVPVGHGGVAFDLPALAPGAAHPDIFVVPTEKRGVVEVGPATSVRGDPLGLFRRDITWTEAMEVFVHPKITNLDPLGAGLVRDLEGESSQNVSMSDLAFHALREYIPGDDLRHVHWRSSARHGTLLVRQFLDTRRSHLNVIVDCQATAYRDEADYETAISVAGSLLVRAILDDFDATFLSGPHAMTRGTGKAALDACSRAEPGEDSLVQVAARGNLLAPDTSVLFLVTGPHTDFVTLQRAAAQFPIEVGKIAVRVDQETGSSLRRAGDLPVLTLGSLAELPALLRWGLP
jgi:uncharacterized protein (DUF58 family)